MLGEPAGGLEIEPQNLSHKAKPGDRAQHWGG